MRIVNLHTLLWNFAEAAINRGNLSSNSQGVSLITPGHPRIPPGHPRTHKDTQRYPNSIILLCFKSNLGYFH